MADKAKRITVPSPRTAFKGKDNAKKLKTTKTEEHVKKRSLLLQILSLIIANGGMIT